MPITASTAMKSLSICLAVLIAAPGIALAQDSDGMQYDSIEPELKCHYPRKERSFCDIFPNFSLRRGICNPEPVVVGHMEWRREEITVTERGDKGEMVSYDAVVVTYRPVYENGAWGKKFKRTYRREPTLVEPPKLGKAAMK